MVGAGNKFPRTVNVASAEVEQGDRGLDQSLKKQPIFPLHLQPKLLPYFMALEKIAPVELLNSPQIEWMVSVLQHGIDFIVW